MDSEPMDVGAHPLPYRRWREDEMYYCHICAKKVTRMTMDHKCPYCMSEFIEDISPNAIEDRAGNTYMGDWSNVVTEPEFLRDIPRTTVPLNITGARGVAARDGHRVAFSLGRNFPSVGGGGLSTSRVTTIPLVNFDEGEPSVGGGSSNMSRTILQPGPMEIRIGLGPSWIRGDPRNFNVQSIGDILPNPNLPEGQRQAPISQAADRLRQAAADGLRQTFLANRAPSVGGNLNDYAWGAQDLDRIVTQLMDSAEELEVPGMGLDYIKKLPVLKLTDKHVENAKQCSVCFEIFVLDENVMSLPCEHIYHEPCIIPWLLRCGNCPICRKMVSPESRPNYNRNNRPVFIRSSNNGETLTRTGIISPNGMIIYGDEVHEFVEPTSTTDTP